MSEKVISVYESLSKHLKGQLDLPLCDMTLFNQGGQLDPPVHDVTFFNQGGLLRPCVSVGVVLRWRLFVTFYPHHQFSKGRVCLFLTFYPHHQIN